MRGYFIAFLLVTFLLAAFFLAALPSLSAMEAPETDQMEIESASAQYDGRKISLLGDVRIDHELGTITAQEVVLYADPDEKKPHFRAMTMSRNVKIQMKDGGELSCAKAELDYKAMLGKFLSHDENDFVSYWENCRSKNGLQSLLNVKSRSMEVEISRKDAGINGSPKSSISRIFAIEDVVVDYNSNFTAFADRGIYQREEDSAQKEKTLHKLPGKILLLMDDPKKFCRLVNKGGDTIHAGKIDMDTASRQIGFDFPKGTLVESSIDFEADRMLWDNSSNILTLMGNVVVNQAGLGKITTDKEMRIQRSPEKQQLQSIGSIGKTILVHVEEAKELCHTLICQGKVFLDHEKGTLTMDSPLDAQGKAVDGQQVFFHDQMGEIQADTTVLSYQMVEGKVVPVKILLEGNVRILDRKADNPADDAPILHYALADSVEYVPGSKEMLFKAAKKKRVLFYDKVNNVQVSAPAIKIKRDGNTNKDSMQGIGDVRLSFVESEFEQLREKFNLELEKKD